MLVRTALVFWFACALVFSMSSPSARAQDPPNSAAVSFKINSVHTGSINTSGLTLPLQQKWSVDLGATVSYPLVIGGRVFVIAAPASTLPSTLYALDEQSGAVIWQQPAPYGPWIGAAYENGLVFVVPTSGNGLDGAMFAFAASDGHQVFDTTLPSQYSFSSPPSAFNGIVYTGGAGEGGTVYAVSERTGALLWTGSVENGDNSSPAVDASGVYVSYACPQTYRFNPNNGQLIWHYSGECEGGGGNTPVLYRGLLYVRDLYNFPTTGITLSAQTGELTGPGFNSDYSPAFSGSTAIYTQSSLMTASDVTTGITIWTATPPSGDTYSVSPIIVNGIVYVGTTAGKLLGYRARDGRPAASANLGTGINGGEYFAVPQVGLGAGDGLLLAPAGTKLFAFQ